MLPPVRSMKTGTNRVEQRGAVCQTKLCAPLRDVSPVVVEPVKPEERADWNTTMVAHHPLGFTRAIGAHQRYWIPVQDADGVQVVGALLFGAAAKALAVRDEWIGWTPEQRRRLRSRIVNNNHYLILPEVRIPHLASHALALAAYRIRSDWQVRYGYEPVLLEMFVEPDYAGTLYMTRDINKLWLVNGRERRDLFGCTDVDIGVTPASNSLPIRRLNLQIGETRDVVAAWVRFPEFRVDPMRQRYTRIDQNTYLYESVESGYRAELTVGDCAVVEKYVGEWIAVTESSLAE